VQLVTALGMYGFTFPVMIEIYFQELNSVINLDTLKLDTLLDLIKPGLNVVFLLKMSMEKTSIPTSYMNMGFTEGGFWANLLSQMLLPLIFVVLIVLIGIGLNLIRNRVHKKVRKLVRKLRKSIFWDQILRFVTFSHLKICFQFLVFQATFVHPSTPLKYIVIGCCYYYVFVYPLILAFLVVRTNNPEIIDSDLALEKFPPIVSGIKSARAKRARYFFALYILRRSLFAIIPFVLSEHPCQQF
jgi:hypothetical protein